MKKTHDPMSAPGERDFVISRDLDAPRELVFEAWTNPRQVQQWWGPRGFSAPVCQIDLRPGGSYRIVMRGPDGTDYPVKGVYREVVVPARIVATDDCSEHPQAWKDQITAGLREEHPSLESVSTVTFDELNGGRTRLTVRSQFATAEVRNAMVRAGMNEGWSETLDELEEHLAKMTQAGAKQKRRAA